MALTKEQLEAARAAGSLIIASERVHGRPQHFHVVGFPEGPAPSYTCDMGDYAIVAPPSDEG